MKTTRKPKSVSDPLSRVAAASTADSAPRQSSSPHVSEVQGEILPQHLNPYSAEAGPARTRNPQCFVRLPPEFEGLSPVQLDYINDQLRAHTYAEVQEQLFTEMGIRVSINKLFRYFQKVQLADQLEIAEDSTEAVEQLLNLYNGRPVDLDKVGLETIKRRALQLAVSPSTKPSLLLNLMRIFTWEHRKSMDEDRKSMNAHRKQMDAEKSAHRKRMAAVAERRAQCSERRARCEEDRVKILEQRAAREKTKQPSYEWPQAQITELIRNQLSEPWPGSAGIPADPNNRTTQTPEQPTAATP
jgi:hypothetical protein